MGNIVLKIKKLLALIMKKISTNLLENNNLKEEKEKKIEITNNGNMKLILTGLIDDLDDDTIEKLKSYNGTIFFNDYTGKYWIMDFEINNHWFESKDIDLVKNEIVFYVFK